MGEVPLTDYDRPLSEVSDPWIKAERLTRMWADLQDWLREARGRDYVTRTPAVVLQKMADLEEQG